MRLLSNLHVKGKPAILPDHAIRRQSHYFIYRPRTLAHLYLRWQEWNRDSCVIRPQCQYDSFKQERKELNQFPQVNENTWLPTSWDDLLQSHKLRLCKPEVLYNLTCGCYDIGGFGAHPSVICLSVLKPVLHVFGK